MKINEISPQECKFTEVLKTLAVIPKKLYYCGKVPKIGDSDALPVVAIVGSRKNTAYGEEVAYRAAYECAKAGIIVVSGLAYGIDSIAHRGALDAGGVTVAVLGTPIDRIYPAGHAGLAREIIEKGGAVMSEYGPSEVAGSGNEGKARFLARNRLIAGLSKVVLIAEAADHSGTLNTAMHTLDQGKDLFVAPGDINRPNSKGCNQLIKQGAIPYLEPRDLIEAVLPTGVDLAGDRGKGSTKVSARASAVLKKAESSLEVAVLTAILQGLNDGEEIIRGLKISPAEFSRTITLLEIKGVVKALGVNRWMVRG